MFCSIPPTLCAICPTSAFSVIQTLKKEGYRHIFEINGRTPNRFEVPHHRITDAAPGLVSGPPGPAPSGDGGGDGGWWGTWDQLPARRNLTYTEYTP